MFKTLIVCLATLAFVNADEGRIVGGQIIDISKAPYLVQLRHYGDHFCGGTLIRNNYVITAAHCIDGKNIKAITVVGGASLKSDTGEQRGVVQAFVPPAYEFEVKDMDIAVLKLDGDLVGKKIRPIPLCSRAVQKGDTLQVSGWGRTDEETPSPDYLSTVFIQTISKEECARAHLNEAKMTDSMICGSVPGEKDACTGDSGGPAVMNGELCGVVSWGIGCGRRDFPGVYTGIDEVRRFIDESLRD